MGIRSPPLPCSTYPERHSPCLPRLCGTCLSVAGAFQFLPEKGGLPARHELTGQRRVWGHETGLLLVQYLFADCCHGYCDLQPWKDTACRSVNNRNRMKSGGRSWCAHPSVPGNLEALFWKRKVREPPLPPPSAGAAALSSPSTGTQLPSVEGKGCLSRAGQSVAQSTMFQKDLEKRKHVQRRAGAANEWDSEAIRPPAVPLCQLRGLQPACRLWPGD